MAFYFYLCTKDVTVILINETNRLANPKNRNHYLKGNTWLHVFRAIIELSKFLLPTLKATEMSLNNENMFQAIELELK